MAKPTLDALFLKHLGDEQYTPGKCFLCQKECEPDGVVHGSCADAYCDDKKKRCQKAWDKALAEVKQ